MRREKGVQEGFNTFLNALFLFHFMSKKFSVFLQSNNSSDCIIREKYTKWEFTRQKATRHERGFSGKSHSNML